MVGIVGKHQRNASVVFSRATQNHKRHRGVFPGLPARLRKALSKMAEI